MFEMQSCPGEMLATFIEPRLAIGPLRRALCDSKN